MSERGLSEVFLRLGAPPSEAFTKYVTVRGELDKEMKFFSQFCQVDLAHTVMLAEQGIISRDQATAILRVLKEIQGLGSANFHIDPGVGSLLMQFEKFMNDRIGEEIAGRMHTGRSRIDQEAAVLRLYSRDAVLSIMKHLSGLQAVLLRLAEDHVDTIMPGYTHLQHAQPWTFGHYLLSNFDIFNRDFQRLRNAYERTNLNPLGTAALAGTSWPLDRNRTKELLGFDDIVVNSKDAGIFGPDFVAEIAGHLAILLVNVGRVASDLTIWSTFEFRLIELADAYCGSSSMMPQKKNPSSLERLKAIAGRAIGWQASVLGILKTSTSSDADPYYDDFGLPEIATLASDALNLLTGVVNTVTVNKAVMKERAGINWGTASNLADLIVRQHELSYRQAHKVVSMLVRLAVEGNKTQFDVTAEMLRRAAELSIGRTLVMQDDEIRKALDPGEFVATRRTVGSVNPKEIRAMISDAKNRLEAESLWLEEQGRRLGESARMLNERVVQLMN